VTTYELDETDRRLLGLLQENARYTATELAERIGVSDNTIHNRMDRLEEAGVVTGYAAAIDHDRAGIDLHFVFSCTARISDRSRVADEILEIPEIVEVTELMTGRQNLIVKALASDDERITEIAQQLDALDLEIDDENMIRAERSAPFEYDGSAGTATGDADDET